MEDRQHQDETLGIAGLLSSPKCLPPPRTLSSPAEGAIKVSKAAIKAKGAHMSGRRFGALLDTLDRMQMPFPLEERIAIFVIIDRAMDSLREQEERAEALSSTRLTRQASMMPPRSSSPVHTKSSGRLGDSMHSISSVKSSPANLANTGLQRPSTPLPRRPPRQRSKTIGAHILTTTKTLSRLKNFAEQV